ncbi:signal recognition particle subunit srp68 [Coemansia sp. RSA 2337]|nr:signal recognition particle subunit srp68 [Coemansia sp. RSA 2337]
MSKTSTDQAPIEFGIFGYIHESRQTYGLRAQDYLRYRRFCAHRLRNVRSGVKLTQGTSTAFRKKEVTVDMVKKPEHLEILLLQAERAWAFAMDLRELYSRTEEPRQRYHLIRRLRAACKAGEQLAAAAAASSGTCDGRTSLEAQAYKLQMQSQLFFELGEWTSALDCAVLSRVISEQLALLGSSRHYALAHAMIEALDPIVRLAAYRARMAGAQQSQPAELAAQWYSTKMLGDVTRAEQAIPGYSDITAALDALVASANSSASGDAQVLAYANSLKWRGGVVSYASQELAVLIKDAQGALQTATEGGDALDVAAAAFKRVKKAAHRCHSEAIAASAKIHSTASEALESAYLAVQLYSTCALHSIAIARGVGQAKDIAAKLGIAIEAADKPPLIGRSHAWILDSAAGGKRGSSAVSKRGGQKGGITDNLAEGTQVVVLYDMVRKNLSSLKTSATAMLERMMPATSRAVHGHQIIEEVAAAEAYYGCVRGYYSAALHASAAHGKLLDALALLDSTLSEDIPHALALATAGSSHAVSQSDSLPVDDLWCRAVMVTNSDIDSAEYAIKRAIPIVSRLCAITASADSPAAQRKSGPSDWVSDPTGRPVMVANELAASASKSSAGSLPQYVPKLVDLTATEFVPVPIKPLFYDLAASSIDFDMELIGRRSGKSSTAAAGGSSSKLGSIIGSLWGSR